MLRAILAFLLAFLLAILAVPVAAQDREVPYWASIRASELNMRVGPSADYRIDWVYKRKGLPVKVIRLKDGWRLIQDPDGAQGWVVARLLTPERTAIVTGDGLTEMRAEASATAQLRWKVEPGVSGKLLECDAGWCRLDVNGRRGWVPADRLWGAGEP